jgi:hypothetical protein
MEYVVGHVQHLQYPGYEVLTPTNSDGSTVREDRSRTFWRGGKRDGRRLKNDLSYYLVIPIVVFIVIIQCASLRGGKHEEHLVPCGSRAAGWNIARTSTRGRPPRE